MGNTVKTQLWKETFSTDTDSINIEFIKHELNAIRALINDCKNLLLRKEEIDTDDTVKKNLNANIKAICREFSLLLSKTFSTDADSINTDDTVKRNLNANIKAIDRDLKRMSEDTFPKDFIKSGFEAIRILIDDCENLLLKKWIDYTL